MTSPVDAEHSQVQHSARHREEAEGVRVELRVDLTLAGLFDRAPATVTCIVHQHADTAEPRLGVRHSGRDLCLSGYVERDAQPDRPGLCTRARDAPALVTAAECR